MHLSARHFLSLNDVSHRVHYELTREGGGTSSPRGQVSFLESKRTQQSTSVKDILIHSIN